MSQPGGIILEIVCEIKKRLYDFQTNSSLPLNQPMGSSSKEIEEEVREQIELVFEFEDLS
jgi:hypothetical protein